MPALFEIIERLIASGMSEADACALIGRLMAEEAADFVMLKDEEELLSRSVFLHMIN